MTTSPPGRVVDAMNRFLRSLRRVVGSEEEAVFPGDGGNVVVVCASPFDALAGVQHDRLITVLAEIGLVEAVEAVEELPEGAVGLDAVGLDGAPAEVVVPAEGDDPKLASVGPLSGDGAAAGLDRTPRGRSVTRSFSTSVPACAVTVLGSTG